MLKRINRVRPAAAGHWVGDGFPVRSFFSLHEGDDDLSPFLLLDYAGPAAFPPTGRPRGVGQHPHKGFETVTIVYQGELEHRDSTGQHGTIGAGDVQWMTAASGILHEEHHSRAFSERGGTLEMVQLWVNLPARDKLKPAGYQTLLDRDIPSVDLGGGVRARVIAGALRDAHGPARTFTPMLVCDVRLARGAGAELPVSPGFTTAVIVLKGPVTVNHETVARDARLIVFDRDEGERIHLATDADEAAVLLLDGEPIDEPVMAYGPFVLSSRDEIRQAIRDFEHGRFA